MEKIIYSKYSNDRRREFAIRTDICCDDKGNKAVYKTAMFPEGKQHLNHMYNYYVESKKNSACSEMGLAECSWETERSSFVILRRLCVSVQVKEAQRLFNFEGNELR